MALCGEVITSTGTLGHVTTTDWVLFPTRQVEYNSVYVMIIEILSARTNLAII